MLLGFIWGLVFFVFEVVDPYTLADGGAPVYDDIGGMLEATTKAQYLSFVTLTTLGYGDVTPVTAPTRTLAVLEAITGQLFLIVMISRFVGLNVAHSFRAAEQRTAHAAAKDAAERVEAAHARPGDDEPDLRAPGDRGTN
jgi:voltage-gated potassium channel Kch